MAIHVDPQPALNAKQVRRDPAYRKGYERGYQQGANDSAANSSSYNDQSGPVYEAGDDGYSAEYGERERYQKVFRLGYVVGYKEGWDYNAGRYCATCNR